MRLPKTAAPLRAVLAVALALLLLPAAAPAAVELLPDLAALPPEDIAVDITADGRHLLRFTQKFANLGQGPLRVRGVKAGENVMAGYQEIFDADGQVVRTRPASSVIFHPHHKHWHADDIAAYELRRGAPFGPVAAKNGKISYCLVDNEQVPDYTGRYHPPTYLNCEKPDFGLSPGWIDAYHADLYDQWVDATHLSEDGVYYLVVTGDPAGIYIDADDSNNTAWVKLELSGGVRQVRVMAPDEVRLLINGELVRLPVPTRITGGHAMGHVRLLEHLGAAVAWDGHRAIITRGERRLEITPGETVAVSDGQSVAMPTGAFLEEGRILVPIRFLAEWLGARVSYDWLRSTVSIDQ